MTYSHISVAVPALDETDTLPLLLDDIRRQDMSDYTVYVCVNNPEAWHDDGDERHREAVLNNARTLEYLRARCGDFPLVVLDRSSRGCGMGRKECGVGFARKQLFEAALSHSEAGGLVVSLDADTRIGGDYFSRVLATFNNDTSIDALAVPYYHRLSGAEEADRSLLRYECYMRHYLINMMRIGSPYAFTAIGSAMTFTTAAYRRVGGITPLMAGEDFYLMQKFAKTGCVACWLDDDGQDDDMMRQTALFPSGRLSVRVPFGTGPAVALPIAEQESRYPFFPSALFDRVEETYALFGQLFEGDVETPMSPFLMSQLATDDIWGPLRRNFKRREIFVHACHERVDGLRILQYLKHCMAESPAVVEDTAAVPDFAAEPVAALDGFRNSLFSAEMKMRKTIKKVNRR